MTEQTYRVIDSQGRERRLRATDSILQLNNFEDGVVMVLQLKENDCNRKVLASYPADKFAVELIRERELTDTEAATSH